MTTTRAAYLMTFNAQGRTAGDFISRNAKDWRRDYREARERAGVGGTVLLYGATVSGMTGKLISVSASPSTIRAAAH